MWQLLAQNKIITLLEHELKAGQLPHANLISGPHSIGKMTLALDIAQALNCEEKEPPCGSCRACLRIKAGKHPDIHIIDLDNESQDQRKQEVKIGIEHIKDIQSGAKTPTYEGKYKVFIINGAENFSIDAANTLLKTIEEPPPQVVILLLAVSEAEVLPTIVSRCQRIELLPLPGNQITNMLIERYHIAPSRAEFLARIAHGCPGWAINALQDDKVLTERSQILDTLIEIIGADIEKRLNFAGYLANEFSRNRRSLNTFFALWSDWWRDLFLVKERHKEFIINIDREEELVQQAAHLTTRQITDFIRDMQKLRSNLVQNANPHLVFELLMLNAPSTQTPVH